MIKLIESYWSSLTHDELFKDILAVISKDKIKSFTTIKMNRFLFIIDSSHSNKWKSEVNVNKQIHQ